MSDLDHLIYDGCGKPSHCDRPTKGSVRPTQGPPVSHMTRYRCAYRHDTGEVEGFVGVGSSQSAAVADAHEQIRRKVMFGIIPAKVFDEKMVITSPNELTAEVFAEVKADWDSGLRYDKAGNPVNPLNRKTPT